VMPCDTMAVSLKPSGFFEQNPALDVPQSTQGKNKSVLIEDTALTKAMHTAGNSCGRESKL
jgi:primary-amine oxidase